MQDAKIRQKAGEECLLHSASPDPDRPADKPSDPATNPASEGLEAVWRTLRELLRAQIPRQQFETWFRRAALVHLDDERLGLAVQNAFTRDWLKNYYLEVIEAAVQSVLGTSRTIEFAVDPELTTRRRHVEDARDEGRAPAELSPAPARALETRRPRRPAGSAREPHEPPPQNGLLSSSDVVLNPQYRFDNFVVGPCNRFAHAAAVGVGESPGKAYNPFFLHGSVGLGKTHLLQSLCYSLLDRNGGTNILYLSCETFVNHFISALENGDIQRFRTKYRYVDVLVVDDIHLLANKERTQEEFFHTFNTLYNAGKQIVLSSDSPPKDIPTLQGRLVSRFKWGLVTEIEPPCYETRMAILKRKSRDRGHELPDEVARILAEHIDTNIRELEGAVTKILGYASLSGQRITPELARQCLREVFVDRRGQPSTEDILRVVTEHFGVKLSDLQSRKRTAAIAFPRQVGMYLARKVTRLSLEEIGGFFGGRDHSTVLYGVQKIDRLSQEDPACADLLVELRARLRSSEA